METTNILPVLDTDVLQQKANEFAVKGAIKAIEDFYTGYDSPYKKAITANLMNKGVDTSIEIPDIIGILNSSISAEIDRIANSAVSKTFIPMVKSFLTRADAEIKLSDILKEFIESTDYENDDDAYAERYSVEIKKDDGSFTYLVISDGNVSYEVHFYFSDKNKNKENPKVKVGEIYTLPYVKGKNSSSFSRSGSSDKAMKMTIDGVTLEMPFTPNVLEDKFVSYVAKLIIANTKITFDVDDFDEDMFPKRENCHCD